MPDPEQARRELAARFVALGVRDDVADYLSRAPKRRGLYAAMVTAQIALMFGPLVAIIPLYGWWFAESAQRTLEAATQHGALLTEGPFGVWLFVTFIAWFVLSAAIAGIAQLALPRDLQAALFVAGLPSIERQPLTAAWLRRSFASVPAHYRPEEIVQRHSESLVRWFGAAGILLFALAALSFARERNAYTLYMPTQVSRSSFLPWSSSVPRPYAEAAYVELGCNHVTGKNASDDIVYEIHFSDGFDVSLDEAKPVAGSWLDNAERIDAELQRAGVRFVRWSWLQRNPLHPKCLSAQHSGPEPNRQERIDRLLRAGDTSLGTAP